MSKLYWDYASQTVAVDRHAARSIARDIDFDSHPENPFGTEPPGRHPLQMGEFVGSTRRGGSCNVDQIQCIPHCHGTHTESISHIIDELIPVGDVAPVDLIPALLISVPCQPGAGCGDSYHPALEPGDRVIAHSPLHAAVELACRSAGRDWDQLQAKALVIRTLPEDGGGAAPFLTNQAMQWVVAEGIEHLLVDFPSVDRLQDEGRLTNHRIFWRVEPGARQPRADSRINCTITELISAPPELVDGPYLLSLQLAPFRLDAAPSRPVLFPLRFVDKESQSP